MNVEAFEDEINDKSVTALSIGFSATASFVIAPRHNLARARGQIAEFRDYQKKLPQVKKIVERSS